MRANQMPEIPLITLQRGQIIHKTDVDRIHHKPSLIRIDFGLSTSRSSGGMGDI
jgi:hypothetical protein